MELHERLVTTKPAAATGAPQKEPFADLKNSIHMLVISELGPQLTGQVIDPVGMRDRVVADIRRHLSGETGIARDDRERLTNEIRDCIHDTLQPLGVAVVLECSHLCMQMRGIQKQNSVTTTSAFTGIFLTDNRTREEFIQLMSARLH